MKLIKYLIACGIAAAGFAPSAYAFHAGGVAECEGCHTMHNSLEGAGMSGNLPQFQSGPFLLQANQPSGACLNCHQVTETVGGSYHISSGGITPNTLGTSNTGVPVEFSPGGDFAWLKMNMTGGRGATYPGERNGHNIVSSDFGFVADSIQNVAPGGSYPSANLACSSCHDPHGRYRRDIAGNESTTGLPIWTSGSYTTAAAVPTATADVGAYRILGGIGYQPKSTPGFPFVNPTPVAVAPSSYNGINTSIAGNVTAGDRVAYGSNMSEWCANCHTAMHKDTLYTSGTTHLVHPAGNIQKLTAAVVANYNAYISSGVAGTPPDGAYSALAPFETGNGRTLADYTALKTFQATPVNATTSNNVMCLSCHRAHASAWESDTRFMLATTFTTTASAAGGGTAIYDSTAGTEGYNSAQQTAAYNGRPATLFGPYARNYCNKCHAKD